MKSIAAPLHLSLAAGLIGAALFVSGATAAPSGTVALASHRAVYDLKLSQTRGKRPMQSVRGRILYDFSGSRCDGYALQFRQVSQLDSGEGKVAVSDLRATSWEEGDAKRLRFTSENYLDQKLRESVDGQAERADKGVGVNLTKPSSKSVDLNAELLFPTEHVRHIIAAAREGKTLLEAVVYDGSDTGEKLYDTLTVIGHAIAPASKPPKDAAAGQAALAQLVRWPVTISYFDRANAKKDGEATPVYAISFELYENGISRELVLDYGDFVLSGEMTTLEIKDAKPCP
jgi:hypothetical protein